MQAPDWKSATFEEARSTLKKWREEHARRSEEIVEIWEHVLSRYSGSLKDELWPVLEQVTIAALDSARHDLAIDCIQTLDKKFPGSSRVLRLQALRLESLGNFEDASYLYDKLLDADETNTICRKRKITMLIAKGDRVEAIRQLNEYLTTFVNDTEAWLQLGELFLQESDLARAVFCFEELLLTSPNNPSFLCRLAEIRYSQGGQDNVEIARVYYEKAAKVVPTASSLYGMILCSNYLLPKATSQKKKELISSAQNAADQLIELHDTDSAESATVDRQINLVKELKSLFKSGSFS
ncbi:ER membrane protein complex subunit 2 [Ditylenchus destructor]|nr:ER membrane protein complex subunit 2 [Ditylenchus destructor]